MILPKSIHNFFFGRAERQAALQKLIFDELHSATDAFLAESHRLGKEIVQDDRRSTFSLPADHPLSIRLKFAQELTDRLIAELQ